MFFWDPIPNIDIEIHTHTQSLITWPKHQSSSDDADILNGKTRIMLEFLDKNDNYIKINKKKKYNTKIIIIFIDCSDQYILHNSIRNTK